MTTLLTFKEFLTEAKAKQFFHNTMSDLEKARIAGNKERIANGYRTYSEPDTKKIEKRKEELKKNLTE